jgi:thioredoxin reductase
MTSPDVVVVGGGPAGLSAALMLGRCRRSVVVCDDGRPRNLASDALHGYLSRDGSPPTELLRIGRDEAEAYGIEHRRARVVRIEPDDGRFVVHVDQGAPLSARKVLIATGVEDHLPDRPGFRECYGRSVFHCPYCDGWEWRDRRLAVYGRGMAGASLALSLQTWSRDVVLLGDGPARVPNPAAPRLAARGIELRTLRLRALEHRDGLVEAILFEDGSRLPRDAVFFTTGQHQQATLARDLGCELTRKGTVRTDRFGQTCVEGVFVVGDASRDVQFVVVAAAEGAKAAVAINQQFQEEDGLVVPGLALATSWPPNHPS